MLPELLLTFLLLFAQKEITPELAADMKLDVVPVKIDAVLRDATAGFMSGHGGGGHESSEGPTIPDALIQIFAIDGDGHRSPIQAATDADGRLSADLGLRFVGTEIEIYAITGNQWYAAFPIQAGQRLSDKLRMYRTTSDPRILEQHMNRIVSILDDGRVRVRQITQILNQTFYVFLDTDGYVFPVPEGWTVTGLDVDGESVKDLTVKEREGWGSGVAVPRLIYPSMSRGMQMIGTFERDWPKRQTLDLGFSVPVMTDFMLGLQADVFHYTPGDGRSSPRLATMGRQEMRDVGRSMELFRLDGIPPGKRIPVKTLFGNLPADPKSVFITLFLVAGTLVAGVLGMYMRRARDLDAVTHTEADVLGELETLDACMLRGEISAEDYRQSVTRLVERTAERGA